MRTYVHVPARFVLYRIAGAAQRANDKEDAAETGILFSHTYVICRGAGAFIWKCLRFPET